MKLVKPLLVTIAIAASQVSAETVYRSVDEQGNVTFSDKAVGNAKQEEKISIDAPAPSTKKQLEARQREAELQNAASQAGAPSAPGKSNQKKAGAQAVRDAERRLEEDKQVREGDRSGTAGGGSRLTPAYHERVREAEAELEQARKQMKQTK